MTRASPARIVLLGGESSGKTTLARALAEALGEPWVPEFGREWWLRRHARRDLRDLHHIAREQLRREDQAARQARRVLVCDTSPLTTLGYGQWFFRARTPLLRRLAARPCDLAVLCRADFRFVQDGAREGSGFRALQQRWYRRELARRGLPVLVVRGRVGARVRQVIDQLAALGWLEPDAPAGPPG